MFPKREVFLGVILEWVREKVSKPGRSLLTGGSGDAEGNWLEVAFSSQFKLGILKPTSPA